MDDIHGFLQRIKAFSDDAQKILAKHETSPARIIDLQATLNQIKGLNLKQEKLLEDSVRCIHSKIFRGAYVLAWAAMADYLEEWLADDKLGNLAGFYPNWNTHSAKGLRESTSESQIVIALRKYGYYGKNEEKSLKDLLNRRNLCAHPTTYQPNLNMTLGYLSELNHWFSELDKLKL